MKLVELDLNKPQIEISRYLEKKCKPELDPNLLSQWLLLLLLLLIKSKKAAYGELDYL
jgi:hypothetical protein